MNEMTTYVILTLCALLTAFANFMSRRPKPLGKAWTIPWNGIQFVAVLVILLMVSHLIALHTGQDTQLMR